MMQTILEQLKYFRFKRDDESVSEYVAEINDWLDRRSLAEERFLSEYLAVGFGELDIAVAAHKMGMTVHDVEEVLDFEEWILEELENEEWDDGEEDDEDDDEDWDE